MALYCSNPFDAMLEFQRTIDRLRDSSWLEFSTSGRGALPPLMSSAKATTSSSWLRCRACVTPT